MNYTDSLMLFFFTKWRINQYTTNLVAIARTIFKSYLEYPYTWYCLKYIKQALYEKKMQWTGLTWTNIFIFCVYLFFCTDNAFVSPFHFVYHLFSQSIQWAYLELAYYAKIDHDTCLQRKLLNADNTYNLWIYKYD